MGLVRGYIGSYASRESSGILTFTMDERTGELSGPELYYQAPDCKYLSLREGILASPVKRGKRAGLCALDIRSGPGEGTPGGGVPAGEESSSRSGGGRNPLPRAFPELLTETAPACFVTQDETFIYTANYHEGTVLIYERTGGGPMLWKRLESGEGAGCHQVLFHENYLMVPCLLQDRIRFFDRERGCAPAGEISFPGGTGPRHGIFDRAHRRFFLVSELSNQVFVYEAGDGTAFCLSGCFEILSGESRASATQAPASAAIRLSGDERFLYVSTRFADLITVYRVEGMRLKRVQQVGSGGAGPRDFTLTRDGNFLLAANRTEGGLASFRVNPEDGRIAELAGRLSAPQAVCVVLDEARGNREK